MAEEVLSCSPSEVEEEEQSGSVRTKSVATEKIVEAYSSSPSTDSENPYRAAIPSVPEGLVESTTTPTDSQTTSKVERETNEASPSSKDAKVTLDKMEEEDLNDHQMKQVDQVESDPREAAMEEQMVSSAGVQQEDEDSQLNETHGTEEDGDGHEPVLASTVHKVDSKRYNSMETTQSPTSTHKKSRHKEHKHKSHERRRHHPHQHKDHSRQKHERRKKHQHQRAPTDRARSIHEQNLSTKKKKRKHSSHRK